MATDIIPEDELDAEGKIKYQLLEEYQEYSDTFIETGTAGGRTARYAASVYSRVFTVELDRDFYDMAVQKFIDTPSVTPIYGDSGIILDGLVRVLDRPCVILLDAHYVGSGVVGEAGHTPVLDELSAIFPSDLDWHHQHVVLIDDARLFGTDEAYPNMSLIMDLAKRLGYDLEVRDDVIRMTPR